MRLTWIVIIRAVWISVALIGPCGVAEAQSAMGAGATLPAPLINLWLSQYRAKTGVDIQYKAVGDGGGSRLYSEGRVDFAVTSVASFISEPQPEETATPIPFLADQVAVCYNVHAVTEGLRLTPDVLAGIFLGHITRWNDPRLTRLNPSVKLPNEQINTIHHSDASTTTNTFTNYLSSRVKEWRDKVGAGKSVKWVVGFGGRGCVGVLGILKQTEGAIGYAELPNAIPNAVTMAALPDATGRFVLPAAGGHVSLNNPLLSAEYRISKPAVDHAYPMCGFSYVLILQSSAAKPLVKEWLSWVLTDGQSEASPLGFSSMPPEIRRQALRKLDSM